MDKMTYFKVPIKLFQDGKDVGITNSNNIILYSLIMNNYFQFGHMNWKNETISEKLYLTEDQIKKALSQLKQKNWIQISKKDKKREITPIHSTLKYSWIYRDNQGEHKQQYIMLQFKAIQIFNKCNFEYDKSLLIWSRINDIQATPYLNKYTLEKCSEEFCITDRMCRAYIKELKEKDWIHKQDNKWTTTDIFMLYSRFSY